MRELPPCLANGLSRRLYADVIATVPLFQGLSLEIINSLCLAAKTMIAVQTQAIFTQVVS